MTVAELKKILDRVDENNEIKIQIELRRESDDSDDFCTIFEYIRMNRCSLDFVNNYLIIGSTEIL